MMRLANWSGQSASAKATSAAAALLVLALTVTVGAKAPPAKPFERLVGCRLEPDEWTDGDSFRVRLPNGRLETFRLYFVDTTESRSRGERSDQQARYFGISRERAIELGEKAKSFTASMLAKPFTIETRWRRVYGGNRYYAIISTAAGEDLIELLIRNGLARIYGTRTPLPDGRSSPQYRRRLRQLEAEAKRQEVGGWSRSETRL
jgi:endonuclease YncB( thermonuclease family)